MKKKLIVMVLSTVVLLISCNKVVTNSPSQGFIKSGNQSIVNIPHTKVKRQTIGNCWIYSTVAMIESMVLKSMNKSENFSETYLTYWDFYDKLLHNNSGTPKQIIDAGNFPKARLLIRKYGLIREKDFIPAESESTGSEIQSIALKEVNKSLKEGALKELLGYKLSLKEMITLVKNELDRIFNIKMADKISNSIKAKDIFVTSAKTNEQIDLDSELYNWVAFPFTSVFSGKLKIDELDYSKQIILNKDQQKILTHLKKTLNRGFPAMINWFLDTNALEDGEFNIANIKQNGVGSNQGGHITVLEDYTSSGVDPTTGKEFYLDEGETTSTLKRLALDHGKIDYLVVKNSWGTDPQKTKSYLKDGEYGYHRIKMDYLLTWIEVKAEKKTILPIMSIVLPKM